MEKDNDIIELTDNLSRTNFVISFLEQENMQLKVNQLILNRHKVDASKKEIKGKEIVQVNDSNQHEEKVRRKRTRTRGLEI